MPGPPRYPWNHAKVRARFRRKCRVVRGRKTNGKYCRVFTGGTDGGGYGRFRAWGFPGCSAGKVKAHRYAWALVHGLEALTDPLWDLDHRCRRRNCVEPAHLEPISHIDHAELSNADRWSPGGGHRAKLRLVAQARLRNAHPEPAAAAL